MEYSLVLAQVVLQGLMIGAVYALIGTGLTMVFAIIRLLNFAHGSVMVSSMYLCLVLYTAFGLDPYISIGVTVPAMVIIGFVIYQLFIKRVLTRNLLAVIQLTLGLVFIIESSLLLGFSGNYQTVPSALTASLTTIGPISIRTPLVLASVVSIVIALSFWWILQYTDFGRSIRATAASREVAALMGINVTRIQMLVFIIGIAFLGIVGPMMIPLYTMTPQMGLMMTLFGFIILVVGGAGNFLGALVGGLIVGLATALGQFYFGVSLAAAIPYAIFVLILIFRPQGLLGTV